MAKFLEIARRPAILAPALAVAFAVLLFLRRGDTLLVPGVWAEEGTTVLAGIESSGVATLLEPIAGYYGTIPKLIGLAGYAVSATQFPLITAILGWLFSIGVGLVIAFAPTNLRWRPLAAFAVFLIPTDPEVFGVGLYSLWWSGLLVFLVVLWRPESRDVAIRVTILVVAGLSSPVILIAAPLLVVRAVVFRRDRRELIVNAVGVVVASVQGLAIVLSPADSGETRPPSFDSVVPVFFGNYLVDAWTDSPARLWVAGIALIALVLAAIVLVRPGRVTMLALVYLAGASILISLSRIGDTEIHPVLAGPRYFFFPYVLFAWGLLALVRRWPARGLAALPVAALALASLNASGGWSRTNDDLRWASSVVACQNFDSYPLPVHTSGSAATIWNVDLPGKSCRAWLARDPFFTPGAEGPALAWAMAPLACCGREDYVVLPIGFVSSDLSVDFETRPPASDGVVMTSRDREGAASITFLLDRGDALAIRTSTSTTGIRVLISGTEEDYASTLRPSEAWSRLQFSRLDLPAQFEVTVVDGGGTDTWFDVVTTRSGE